MKIAIVTNFLYPEGIGGTELFCNQLAIALTERGNEVYWFVPNFKSSATLVGKSETGINVVRFAAVDSNSRQDFAFISKSFTSELKRIGIEVAHFNEFGGEDGISTGLLAAAKKSGVLTVVTLHLVNYICRNSMMQFGGLQPCNGKVVLHRCSSCALFSNATDNQVVNYNLSKIFEKVFSIKAIQSLPKIKRIVHGVRLKQLFMNDLKAYADRIVTLTDWFKDVLLINGFPADKIAYIPQVSPEVDISFKLKPNRERKHYVFFGRVNKEKGVDLILEIAARLKHQFPGVYIDIYGSYTPTEVLPHTIISNLHDFDNVRYKGVLHASEVLSVMNNYKAVILPSRVAEMAPLIIMEAQKIKVPVIVSDVPGSAELVRKNDCGRVFKYASAENLLKVIAEFEHESMYFNFEQPMENSYKQNAMLYEELYASVK